MTIFLGADHRGFEQKNRIKELLEKQGYEIGDEGAFSYNPEDDFPVAALNVAQNISLDPDKQRVGILFCGSGVGMSITANKIKGVRAGLGFTLDQVKAARHDDDINVLVIPTDYVSSEEIVRLVEVFLETSFSAEEKYKKKKKQIEEIEKRHE